MLSGAAGSGNITNLQIFLSPSGSWTGTTFTDPSNGISPETTLTLNGGWGASDWFHNSGGGHGYLTLIAGLGFFICQAGSEHNNGWMPNGGSSFQIEIPIRLYPQANDPNPICANNFGNLGVAASGPVGYAYGHFKFPSPYDTLTRRGATMVAGYTGAAWQGNIWNGSQQGLNMGRWGSMFYNVIQGKFLLPQPIIGLPTVSTQPSQVGQFSLCRARMRSVRYIAGGYPYYMRVGDDNDRWIHVGGGVMWPWDNAIVNKRLLFAGF